MQIPIENLYYLLCYAWNQLETQDQVKVQLNGTTELVDLFAKVLLESSQLLLKQGLEKSYLSQNAAVPGVKGKLEISETLKQQLHFKLRTHCQFDDFSANVLSNRILVSTLMRLVRTEALHPQLKKGLLSVLPRFVGVEPIAVSPSLFQQVRLHRNNRLYGLLLQVCRLVFESTLPAETPGRFSFVDFRRDERKMARLFEAFVRNFYQREQSRFRVKREVITWQFTAAQDADLFFLPQMETDITLENDAQKLIIDAKFYRETLVSRYEREKLRSAHLYQLFAYLNNQRHADRPHSQSATGILLYPTVQQEVDLNYRFQEHPVLIRTLNLNSPWQQIAERLQAIIQ